MRRSQLGTIRPPHPPQTGVRLVDEKSGLPIPPDAFVFLGVLAAVQLYILGLLLAPLVS